MLAVNTFMNIKQKPRILKYNVAYVVPRGFEPRQTESKSVVLPLYYGTIGVQK